MAVASTVLMIGAAMPVAATSPDLYAGSDPGPISIPGDNIFHLVSGIPVPAGTWWVTGTAVVDAGANGTPGIGQTTCEMFGDDGSFTYRLDESTWALVGHPDGRAVANVYLTGVISVPANWSLYVDCLSQSQSVSVSDFQASAARVSGSSSPMFIGDGAQSATVAGNSTFHTLGALSVPKGKWFIVAKANIVNQSSTQATNEICQVKLSTTDIDQSGQSLANNAGQGYAGETVLEVAHTFTTSGVAALECKGTQAMAADHILLIGIKAGKLTRQPLGGTASTTGTGTPNIITGYKSASVTIANGFYGTVGSLKLPAGNWFVQAKAFLRDASPVAVSCTLTVGDWQAVTYSDGATAGGMTGLDAQTGAKLSAPGKAIIACDSASTSARVTYIRITAISAKTFTVPV